MKIDNELIAQFMGIHVKHYGPVLYFCDGDGMINLTEAEPYWPDRDWNQLMSVVHRIDKMQMFDLIEYRELSEYGVFSSIENIYNAVIDFIKAYNLKPSHQQ